MNEYVKLPSWMDYLKVNAAWAQVSSDLDPYALQATYAKGILYGSTPSVTYPNAVTDPSGSGTVTALVNPDILPQKTSSFEVGMSTSFLHNRLGLDLTYYRMLDENSIIKLPISEASGFPYRFVNGNEYTTNGFELIVNATPVQNKHFTWNVSTTGAATSAS